MGSDLYEQRRCISQADQQWMKPAINYENIIYQMTSERIGGY